MRIFLLELKKQIQKDLLVCFGSRRNQVSLGRQNSGLLVQNSAIGCQPPIQGLC